MVSREARFKRLHTERFCFEKVKTIRTALGSVTGDGGRGGSVKNKRKFRR